MGTSLSPSEKLRKYHEMLVSIYGNHVVDSFVKYNNNEFSRLNDARAWKKAPLQNVVEPFFKVLGAFCPIDQFKKMLLEPENCGKEPQKIFENAVAWLLSLAGFYTIYLAARESLHVLRAKESKYEIGSADIIAYEDNERLLLVDCDIGTLNEKKIQELIEVQRHFEKLDNNGKIKFVPVLFSPRTCVVGKDRQVAVVDRNIIESILEELAKGDRESARSLIFDPALSGLPLP